MNGLPEGWIATKLTEVCALNPVRLRPNQIVPDLPVTFVPMAAIDAESGTIASPSIREYSAVAKGFTSFQENDVIMAKITPCMENGKAAIARRLSNGIGFGSTEFHVFRPSAAALPEYVFYLIRQESFRKSAEANMTGSVGQKRVPASFLNEHDFPLPPLAEQRRIVAKLKPLISSIDAYQQRFVKIPVILKRFRQAVLAAACSGQLTVGWRNENSGAEPYQLPEINDPDRDIDLPSTWESTKLGNLTTLVTSGSRGWAEYYADSGSMFIRAQNINSDYLNLDDIAYVDLPDKTEGKRTKVRQYDLLITITGANVTKSALVETSIEDAYVSQQVALVRLADQRLSKFAFYWIISIEHGRKQLQESAYGAGKPGLNLDNIREVSVAIPPLAEQQEIVRHVETLFKLVDQIEARYQRAKPLVDKLQQSILAKAFRGELVPTEAELARREGRDYEPASALLERIRSERSEHAQGRKEKARSQPKPTRKRKVTGIMVSNGAEKELK